MAATIAVVLGGMALSFLDKLTAGGMLGNLLSIASGVSYATLIVLLRTQKDGSPFMAQGAPDASGWLSLIMLGVFHLGLAHVLYSTAIKHITALEAALIPVSERPGPVARHICERLSIT